MAPDCAVIFDVDGVLLDLTEEEENVFFAAFAGFCDPNALSRDWNCYLIRNDDDIVDEIMVRHGIAPHLKPSITGNYFSLLSAHLDAGGTGAEAIAGAVDVLAWLSGKTRLGIATANFREAARLRLARAGLWSPVSSHAVGADGGGHKTVLLGRAIATLGLPPDRIVYVGDNLNDVAAGLAHGVHFIGFSQSDERRRTLAEAGASTTSGNHGNTLQLIRSILDL